MQAKLNQSKSCVIVRKVMGRDVRSTELEAMIRTLRSWCSCSDALITSLHEKIEYIKNAQEQERQRQERVANQIGMAKKNLRFTDSDGSVPVGVEAELDDASALQRRGKRRHVAKQQRY